MNTKQTNAGKAGLGANPNKVKDMDFIECLNFLENQIDGKEAISCIRRVAGIRSASHKREVWAAIERIWKAHCHNADSIPDKEFND